MTTIDRLSRIFTAIALILGAVLLFIMVNQFIDRISRHESNWLDQRFRHTTEMTSEKLSKGD
jgi:hypothetical protein